MFLQGPDTIQIELQSVSPGNPPLTVKIPKVLQLCGNDKIEEVEAGNQGGASGALLCSHWSRETSSCLNPGRFSPQPQDSISLCFTVINPFKLVFHLKNLLGNFTFLLHGNSPTVPRVFRMKK